MTRTADKIVIHSDDVLEVATSVGGSGARVSAGAWSSIINRDQFYAVKLYDTFDDERGIKEKEKNYTPNIKTENSINYVLYMKYIPPTTVYYILHTQ